MFLKCSSACFSELPWIGAQLKCLWLSCKSLRTILPPHINSLVWVKLFAHLIWEWGLLKRATLRLIVLTDLCSQKDLGVPRSNEVLIPLLSEWYALIHLSQVKVHFKYKPGYLTVNMPGWNAAILNLQWNKHEGRNCPLLGFIIT